MDRLLSMRVFRQVAEGGSFSAAARELDMSPAVVTRLVVDLEEHLGARLLQRTTRRVSLTEAGQAYLGRVGSILQDIEEADALAAAHTQDMAGVLRIQAPPVLAVHILAPLVASFRALHPKVVLDIDVDASVVPFIEDHDITLMGASADFDANVIARPIITSHGVLVAAPAYLARRGPLMEAADLSRHDCLRIKTPGSRPATWNLAHPNDATVVADVPVQPVMWANHTDTLLRATLDGAGISSMPVELAAPYLSQGQLLRVLPQWVTGHFTLYAAMPSRRFIPRRTQAFLDHLTHETRANVAKVMST